MNKQEGTPTIKDVARVANVSVGTVSRVINDKASVGDEIKQRVKQAIATLGYRPNAMAQSMRRRSTHMVGCVIREINIPALAAFVRAAHDVLDEAGFSLLISNSEGRVDRERELLNRLSGQQIDGVIYGPYTPISPEFETFLKGLDMPLVLMDRDEPAWADCVMADHASATFEATSMLLDLGHRRIVLLTGQPDLYPSRARLKGYSDAFASRGIEVDMSLVRAKSFFAKESYRSASSLLGGTNPPTAVIAGGNDLLAGVLRAIRIRGLRIPEDISVIGNGDTELAELYSPPISVVRWDQAEVGQTAAELLANRMLREPDAPAEHVILPAEFIQRGSVSTPPGVS